MTVICIGYFDKFSRYFLDIERHLKNNHDVSINFKIYSIHFSGFLYTLIRLKPSSWISFKAWCLAYIKRKYYLEIISQSNTYKGLVYEDYLSFHKGLNKNINQNKLRLQALAYIDLFDKAYRSNRPDYLLAIGDSRLCIEISVALAKLKKIKIYYIEQGPFNTTFFDDKGVNANLSFRDRIDTIKNLNEKSNAKTEIDTDSKKYNRSLIYRGFDMLLMKLFQQTALYPPDIKYTDVNSYRKYRNFDLNKLSTPKKDKTFLLILQVPQDVNMINHSTIFNSHFEILKSVHSNLPKGAKVIVREHPLYINKYENELYDYISKHNIIIDNLTPLTNAIDMADVVVVNNSTVGIQSIFRYKTVVVVGNAFYDNEKICLKLTHKDQIKTILKQALTHQTNTTEIDSFKNVLFSTVLLNGSITDKDLKSSKHIANHLLADY
ncbi:hypothetical protein [Winogradskyella sp.]|uniref:capsular polysaccharide export protein, LipB/KpsS family n=1 Tax=Winogradskyella sp. TaxID=1883156 RepID=UPI0025EE9EF6|nr:hypothetical protein [Winogradskyella sp.]